mgnify:CR=1 FL=1
MADEELEAGEGGKKSSILSYVLIGVGVIVALAITILATMYFVGYFDPDSAERIEEGARVRGTRVPSHRLPLRGGGDDLRHTSPVGWQGRRGLTPQTRTRWRALR